MYTLIGSMRSRAMRVAWALEELGLPWDHRPEPPHSAAVLALTASGKVPVLLDGDSVLTDSTAILTCLADRHGGLTAPAGTSDRARQDAATFWALGELDAILWTAARHSFVLPEEHRVAAVKNSLKWEFARATAALSARLGAAPYLMGDALTIPDIVTGHCLFWAKMARFPTGDDRLAAYADRLRARPAFRAAAARD